MDDTQVCPRTLAARSPSLCVASIKVRRFRITTPGRTRTTSRGRPFTKWHTIKNQADSVTQDVRRIREHPLVPTNVPVYGYVYDVRTGRLDEVKTATEAGRAAA